MLTEKWYGYRNASTKIFDEVNRFKIYCKCGHAMVFYPMEKKNKKNM